MAKTAAKKSAKTKAKARIGSGLLTKILIAVLLAAMVWQMNALRGQVEAAELQRQQLAVQVAAKQAENASLQESIAQGGSEEEMLRIAREELGLVSPNEKVFYDTSN